MCVPMPADGVAARLVQPAGQEQRWRRARRCSRLQERQQKEQRHGGGSRQSLGQQGQQQQGQQQQGDRVLGAGRLMTASVSV